MFALSYMRRLFLLSVALSWSGVSYGESSDLSVQVKAAYLYKFLSYVEWPASTFEHANSPLVIGVIGADDIAEHLKQIKDSAHVLGRGIDVRFLKPGDSLVGLHILFVGHGEHERIRRTLEPAQTLPVLTVTDAVGALALGGTINFLMIDNHIRFEVSLTQAERRRLKISARLLAVAQKVESYK